MQVWTESLPLRTYLCYGFQNLPHRMLHCRIVHFRGIQSGYMRPNPSILDFADDKYTVFVGKLIGKHVDRPRNS